MQLIEMIHFMRKEMKVAAQMRLYSFASVWGEIEVFWKTEMRSQFDGAGSQFVRTRFSFGESSTS